MKINIERDLLLMPLQTALGVVEQRKTIPILSHVLITLAEDKLQVCGTDCEIELTGISQLPEKASDEEKFTLPGRMLYDVCRILPEKATIELSVGQDGAVLRSGQGRYSLVALPTEDFPFLQQEQANTEFSIDAQLLRKMLEHTHFAMGQADVRYYLNGILWHIEPGKLTMVASDGHRMALESWDDTAECLNFDSKIILPRKAVGELLRLLSQESGNVAVKISENHCSFGAETFTLTSKLIDGAYPDYQFFIPKQGNYSFVANCAQLKQVLALISIYTTESRLVRFDLQENKLHVSSKSKRQEEGVDEMEISYQGEALTLGFNVNYLMDCLSAIDEPEVKMSFSDPQSAILVEAGSGQSKAIYVIMPVSL